MVLNERKVFLFDGAGACLSLFLTGFLLPALPELTGLPTGTLRALAIFPLAYGIYSFTCYRLIREIKAWMLLVIMGANFFYCLVSASVILLFKDLTLWGQLFLAGEVLILLAVIYIEWRVYQKAFRF